MANIVENNKNLISNEKVAPKAQCVQDTFLNYVRKNKIGVTVFLVNGVKLQGMVTGFDSFSILLRRDAHSQLVYKHAISTVMPMSPVQLYEGMKDMDEPEMFMGRHMSLSM